MIKRVRDNLNCNCPFILFCIILSILYFSFVMLEPSAFAVNYKLPFPCGESYEVTQGNYADSIGDDELPDPGNSHGCFDANKEACDEEASFKRLTYGFDFVPDEGPVEGAEVVAAAKGTVEHVKWDKEGTDPPNGNHIIIRHDDGSVTMYLHLQKNSIPEKLRKKVKNKDATVVQGEKVGNIGSTGLVNGAHLHFQRRIGKESVPINFFDVLDNCGIPVATRHYESDNCGPELGFHFALDRWEIDGNIDGDNPDGTLDFVDYFDDKSVTGGPTSSLFFSQGARATCEAGCLPVNNGGDCSMSDGDGFLGLRSLDGTFSSPPFEYDDAKTGCDFFDESGDSEITAVFRYEAPEIGQSYRLGLSHCLPPEDPQRRDAFIGIRNVNGQISIFCEGCVDEPLFPKKNPSKKPPRAIFFRLEYDDVTNEVLQMYCLDENKKNSPIECKKWKPSGSVTIFDTFDIGFAWVQAGHQTDIPIEAASIRMFDVENPLSQPFPLPPPP